MLHGDIPQKTREQTLKDFKEGKFKCLVATDVAARGLDIQGVGGVRDVSAFKALMRCIRHCFSSLITITHHSSHHTHHITHHIITSHHSSHHTSPSLITHHITSLITSQTKAHAHPSQITLVINREPPSTRSGVADVETYIHRSGRTGRAGKKGVCVTLSTGLQQEAVLQTIEKAVGNAFTRIGAPQPSDLLKAKAENLLEQFDNIDPQMVEKMLPLAEEVYQKQADTKQAIARCLCLAVGAIGKMQSRSILTSQDGALTRE